MPDRSKASYASLRGLAAAFTVRGARFQVPTLQPGQRPLLLPLLLPVLLLAACTMKPGPDAGSDGGEAQNVAESPYAVVFEGDEGPGAGKHIVFLAADHEYRSEEILPAMARIMARHYGFRATVLFSLDDDGFILPGSSNMAGLDVLQSADLVVMGLRFQDFPDQEMQHFVDYLDRAGPIIGLRTSTHAFAIKDGPHVRFTWNHEGEDYPLGFGRQVLGETWAGHYGTNHVQSSRILVNEEEADHPVLTGVSGMHVQSGGYEAHPEPPFTVLGVGEVLNGMAADAEADPDKELMPVAWTRSYAGTEGREGRVFTTTHGASEDFLNDGFRRMLVNAALWATGLEGSIAADSPVDLVGPYNPATFAFEGYRRGVRPSDMAGWDTPIMDPSRPTTAPETGSNP